MTAWYHLLRSDFLLSVLFLSCLKVLLPCSRNSFLQISVSKCRQGTLDRTGCRICILAGCKEVCFHLILDLLAVLWTLLRKNGFSQASVVSLQLLLKESSVHSDKQYTSKSSSYSLSRTLNDCVAMRFSNCLLCHIILSFKG